MTFSKDQVFLVFDYETFSEADLKKVGGFEYSIHPSTEILCVAWRVGTRESIRTATTQTWHYQQGMTDQKFTRFCALVFNNNIVNVAHNAMFERCITNNVLSKFITPLLGHVEATSWLCTASLAAALALPRDLEGAGIALGLPIQKDMVGRRLMLKWCKPRKPTKKNPSTRHEDPEELERLVEYCKTDTDTEVELFLRLPPLHPVERRLWVLDQKINLNGFAVDRTLVTRVLKMVDLETARINRETNELTLGVLHSANQRDELLNWLRCQCNVMLPDLQKKTVETILEADTVTGEARQLLEYRLSISKTSTKKFEAFELGSRHDSRLRDFLKFHAASTGRWAGMRVQPQNLPRPVLNKECIEFLVDLINAEDQGGLKEKLDKIRFYFGDPMAVFSDLLRSPIVAPKGRVLDVADYSAIEARVLFWVAEHVAGIQAFKDNRPIYEEMGAKIFGLDVSEVGNDSLARFMGKESILGAGYGMGAAKFAETCKAKGKIISEALAKAAISGYRQTHAPVPRLWKMLEAAAIAAVRNPGKGYTINKTRWVLNGKFLFCYLPSGRRLAYYEPKISLQQTPWGETKPVLWHWGVDSTTKKWRLQKTWGGTLTENVVQAIARDFMAWSMLRIDKTGIWDIVLSVHDELIAERDYDKGSNEQFRKLMEQLPPWGEGCPIKVEGWQGLRYRK